MKRKSEPVGIDNYGKCHITNIITGTDTGSVILQNLLRVIVAAAILIGVVMSIGRKGGA